MTRVFRIGRFGRLMLAFVVVLMPVLLLLTMSYQASLSEQEAEILRGQRVTAEAIAAQIDTVFDDAISFAWALGAHPAVQTMHPHRLDPLLRSVAALNPQWEAIAVFDAKGVLRGLGSLTRPRPAGLDVSRGPLFRAVMATNAPAVTDVPVHEAPQHARAIVAAVPARDATGHPVGMVAVSLSPARVARRYPNLRLQAGQVIVLIDREGKIAFHSAFERTPASRDAYRDLPEVRRAMAGQEVVEPDFFSPLLRNHRLAAFVPTGRWGWVVMVGTSREVALADVHAALRRSMLVFAFIVLLSVTLAYLLARQFIEPLRRLESLAAAFGRGELGTRIAMGTGDELEKVGAAFNRMAEQLQEREAETTRLVVQEQAARAEAEAMKKLDRLKSQFVDAVSHELRTPLATIKGYAEFLEDRIGGELTSTQEGYVHQIQSSTERVTLLVDDLLDFARLEAGTFRLILAEVDLGAKIREVVGSLQPQAAAAHLTLTTSLPEGPLWVRADASRIGQVVLNLINNAIKFTPDRGRIEVRALPGDRDWRFEVSDTGIGIAPEDLPKLFQRFAQLEPGLRKVGGTGLGLSISKAIIDAHGGTIGVQSHPGQGSTFWFTVPRA